MSKLIRDRDARANTRRVSRWDVFWFPATFAAYVGGIAILPRALSPWADAIVWACYATAWVILAAAIEHIIFGLRNRRKPAEAGAPRQELRGWRLAMCFCVLVFPFDVHPYGEDWLWPRFLALLLIVALERVVSALVRRNDAQRRRNELADLARQF